MLKRKGRERRGCIPVSPRSVVQRPAYQHVGNKLSAQKEKA